MVFLQLEGQDPSAKASQGFLRVQEGRVELSQNSDFSEKALQINLLELHFSCVGPDLCSVDNFLLQRQKQMKELDYLELKARLENFMMANSVKDQEACFLLEKEDGRLFFVESLLVCGQNPEVHVLRSAI